MKLECIERFIAFEKDPSLGTMNGCLNGLISISAQAKIQRERLDKAEQFLRHLDEPFPMRFSISNEVWEGVGSPKTA